MSEPVSVVPEAPGRAAADAPGAAREQSPLQRNFAAYCESRIAIAGLVVLVLLCLLAVFAPWVAPQDPYDLSRLDLMDSRLEPGELSVDGALTFHLGSDAQDATC